MIAVDSALRPFVALGVLAQEDARVVEGDPALEAPLAEAAARARGAGPPEAAIAAVRAMYHRFGIDPTKTRPSSEALLRRVRKGEPLPRINTLVDVCNWCSLELQLPYGLYDLDRVEPPIELRRGRPGEQYAGIRRDAVHVEGRPVLADARGPFGNPTADSARTMVTPETTRALVVIFAPRALEEAALARALDVTAERLVRYAGGRMTGRWVVR
jgi:DNA/RNA-binding domain of Phe-tRNA-synthetase-like protein